MWEKWKLMLSTDTAEQKIGMATRRLHQQLDLPGRKHPHVRPQSNEKNSRNEKQRTPRRDCRKPIIQQLATQLRRSIQLCVARSYAFWVQIGHFNSSNLYSSHMILHGILRSVEYEITRTMWWKTGNFLSWAMLCNKFIFNFLYKHIYSTSKSCQRKDFKQQSGNICNVNMKNGGNIITVDTKVIHLLRKKNSWSIRLWNNVFKNTTESSLHEKHQQNRKSDDLNRSFQNTIFRSYPILEFSNYWRSWGEVKPKGSKGTHKHMKESHDEHVYIFLYGLLWGSACQQNAERRRASPRTPQQTCINQVVWSFSQVWNFFKFFFFYGLNYNFSLFCLLRARICGNIYFFPCPRWMQP